MNPDNVAQNPTQEAAVGLANEVSEAAEGLLCAPLTVASLEREEAALERVRDLLQGITARAQARAEGTVVRDFTGREYNLSGRVTFRVAVDVEVSVADYLTARRTGALAHLESMGAHHRLRHVLDELPPSVLAEITAGIRSISYVLGTANQQMERS